ncbi:MAG TPA: tetratricopeptide repeat protein [Tepidisphaeraceae bacterium]|jgi:predicted O-linked N-acetylglucosamine transferase (SPINDLY family)
MTIPQAYELALAHYQAGRHKDAEPILRQIFLQQPDHPDALHLAGLLSHQAGRSAPAADFIRRAILLNPINADYHNNLGLIVAGQGNTDESIAALKRAIALRPDFARAHNNLGTLYAEIRHWDPAIESFRRALAIDPEYAEAESNLASALKETGHLDEAIESYQRAAQLRGDPRIASNLVYLLHFHPGYGPREIADAHREWNRAFAAPLAGSIRSHTNDPSPDRPLRIGYVSPDFRQHPVGRFIAPLLEHHNRDQFQIFCYSDAQRPDELTHRLQRRANVWRNISGMPDEQLTEMIRADGIDILVDLTMHMEGNRLLTFARKPAPVQVTYLAYCGTTGLDAIDYRLSDPYLDPPGGDESVYSEKTVRLQSYWSYEPPSEAPQVMPPPSASTGTVMFGCLNAFSKVTEPTLAAWARILAQTPQSRILIHSGEGLHRQKVRQRFAEAGIDPARVEFIGRMAANEYFTQYNAIDVALDPFPYPGGTTSCDALWMGVPVVTLPGQTAVSRAGVSVLSTIGLPEFIARTVDDYVTIASQLALDVARRTHLRSSLRQRMINSPLMNSANFTRDVEAQMRDMWRNWCTASSRTK